MRKELNNYTAILHFRILMMDTLVFSCFLVTTVTLTEKAFRGTFRLVIPKGVEISTIYSNP
jgi:hypothetical protein